MIVAQGCASSSSLSSAIAASQSFSVQRVDLSSLSEDVQRSADPPR